MEDKQAYTINELTEIGPLGRSSIYKAINAGQLTARKFGRSSVVLADDWRRFLTSLPPFTPRSGRAA